MIDGRSYANGRDQHSIGVTSSSPNAATDSMTRTELIKRGEENIADVNFIRRNFITLAYSQKHWNIVVFECFRVVELLVKGIVCISGHAPRETHSIEHIVDDLINILARQRTAADLFVSLVAHGRNRYGVRLTTSKLSVLAEINGTWTHLGVTSHHLPADELVRITLTVQNFTVTASVDGKILFRVTNTSLAAPYPLRRQIVRALGPHQSPP
jgi:hypothetical protein